jgi:hypothetical protein
MDTIPERYHDRPLPSQGTVLRGRVRQSLPLRTGFGKLPLAAACSDRVYDLREYDRRTIQLRAMLRVESGAWE